ncbi:MAG: glucose-6-phosphate isomerase, partial [Verrucomicrobiales bacterium]|nr:glucose-6-phosphate isomerase [Verrucomicrobiales bacterium]
MSQDSLWNRYQNHLCRYPDLGFSLDLSRMSFPGSFFSDMEDSAQNAYRAMQELEGGGIANPDENRMVGHYWLRNASIAPTPELAAQISSELADIK